MKRLIPIAILVLLSCCYNSEMVEPSPDGIQLSLDEINAFFKTTYDATLLESQVPKIFKKNRLRTIDDKRLIEILNDLRREMFSKSNRDGANSREADPCFGPIESSETVDLSENGDWSGEWVSVYHFSNGSTYYRWYDSNDNVVESGCFTPNGESVP